MYLFERPNVEKEWDLFPTGELPIGHRSQVWASLEPEPGFPSWFALCVSGAQALEALWTACQV